MTRFGGPEVEGSDHLGPVKVSLESEISVIHLAGEIDIAVAEILDDACSEVIARDLPVRIEAARLAFIDSSGLGFLTRLVRSRPGGRPPAIVGARPVIRDTIGIVGLADLVEFG